MLDELLIDRLLEEEDRDAAYASVANIEMVDAIRSAKVDLVNFILIILKVFKQIALVFITSGTQLLDLLG